MKKIIISILYFFIVSFASIIFFIIFSNIYNSKILRKTYVKSQNYTGIINIIEENNIDNRSLFVEELKENKLVNNIGSTITVAGNIGNFIEIQDGHQQEEGYRNLSDLEFTTINSDISGICNLKTLDNKKLVASKDDRINIYLGYAYKDKYKVGDFVNNNGVKYRIQGFIKKNSWFPSQYYGLDTTNSVCNSQNTNYQIFIIYDDSVLQDMIYFNTDNKEVDKKAISKVADKYNININVNLISDITKSNNFKFVLFSVILFVLLILFAIICLIYIKKNNITSGKIFLSIETIMTVIVTSFIQFILFFIFYHYGGNEEWFFELFKNIFILRVYPFTLIFAMIISVIIYKSNRRN